MEKTDKNIFLRKSVKVLIALHYRWVTSPVRYKGKKPCGLTIARDTSMTYSHVVKLINYMVQAKLIKFKKVKNKKLLLPTKKGIKFVTYFYKIWYEV